MVDPRTKAERLLRLRFAAPWMAVALVACSSASSPGGGARPDKDAASPLEAGQRMDAPIDSHTSPPLDGGVHDSAAPHDTGPLPRDPCVEAGTCPPGVWTNVTPPTMSPTVLAPTANAFGPGAVVGDPSRPSDMYIACGGDGVWKSSDYGYTWTQINSTIGYSPIGTPIAVAGTTPATIWVSAGMGAGQVYRSTDGGATFTLTGGGLPADLYSIKVDPNDTTHLISGLHEADGVVESTDSGDHWQTVGGPSQTGWPAGGISFYPSFIDTGSASTTRTTWFAIAQDGAAPVITHDEGASWTIPTGLASPDGGSPNGLQHPHGSSNFYQTGSTLFVGGLYGPGQGVYRSTDLGTDWARVDTGDQPEAIVWGTPKSVYAMYGWACSNCNLGTNYETAPVPGTTWSTATVPAALVIGPNSLVVTNDGTHSIFVGTMWAEGIWRYVEP
jgi:hypothetical protein